MGQRDGSHGQSSLHPGTPLKIFSDRARAIARTQADISISNGAHCPGLTLIEGKENWG
jgi:hypothetical protein